ncbi:intraflagellar transport-associated protein isoform X3 [Gopherus flavomarginatus]|uniref:intraflagellar transport-associated protein isoform X3 n=1 Tax=Gopherus flavomarginatus TaxID=286002 RepID=UPI0021CBEE42|nr:intraflagellar transport-associated protein isoform X3 [Gopherus flavomarginatus]
MMEKQPSNNSILDQFINSQEQTYEEFLRTFTYLWKEEVKMKSRVSEMDSIENTFSMLELSNRNKQNVSPVRNKEPSVSLSSQTVDEDQIMMGESWKVGCSNQGDLSLARRVKVDNYLELEDFDTDDEFGQGTYSGVSDDDPAHVHFKNTSTADLTKRKEGTNVRFLKIATALDSRFKNLKCRPKSERDEV